MIFTKKAQVDRKLVADASHLNNKTKPWIKDRGLRTLNFLLFIPLMSEYIQGYDASLINNVQQLPIWQDGTALVTGSVNAGMFIAGRLLLGIGGVVVGAIGPVLVAELAYPSHRATATALSNTQYSMGAIVAAWLTFGTFRLSGTWAWRIPSIFQGLPSVLQAIGILFTPESPRWLVSQGSEEAALDLLAHYHANGNREDEVVQFEFREIVGTIEMEIASKQTRWSEMWRTPGNKWRIFIMIWFGISETNHARRARQRPEARTLSLQINFPRRPHLPRHAEPHKLISNGSMNFQPSYYEVLGLPENFQDEPNISAQTLRSAYRRALLKHHPDKLHLSAETALKASQAVYSIDQISHAYSVLSDSKLRTQYDKEYKLKNAIANGAQQGRQVFRTGVEVVDLDDLDISDEERIWFRSCRSHSNSQRPQIPNIFRQTCPTAISIRHCSYRRNEMCKMHGETEALNGGVDVSKGREILPANVIPRHYDLTLEPDFKNLTYNGTVIIDLDVEEDSTSISLNTLDIDISSTKILSGSETISSSPDLTYNADTQTTKVDFKVAIPKGSKAQLQMAFTGSLNDKMAGFYRSTYKNADGSEGILATTQMEATDARRAFPCFDEPSLKAEFTITLIADKNLTCLSNMDVASESEVHSEISKSTKKAVKFNKSPVMSTYLLAFIVGELTYIETDKFRLPVRVYAPPNQDIEHGRFSLELAARTLEFYEKTFDSKFPLPKMDMVAIPDFSAGAMENWGLVTYRVVDLLFDEKTSGASTKERVAEVVQHELAHQWFGNLVTMDFWDGLWLNEGFATWMSWYSCNVFYPEWKVWQSYVSDTLQSALSLDSLRSSHPIEVPVQRADEINQIFDAISYSKGSCVLRMISKYLGEDVFMEGIRQYLKKHAYGNTQTADLWAALSKASGKDVERVMDIWTKNVGYPVVTVTESAADKTIHVKQNRLLRTADVKPEEDTIIYPVFLGLRTKDGIDEELVLSKREDVFKVPDLDFFKLNADHTNIYRTSYTPARLEKLGKAAKDGLLSVEDRAGLLADAGALAQSGYQKTSGVLNLLKGFDSETEFVVWNEILTRLASIHGAWIFEDKSVNDGLEAFQRDLVSEKAHKAGWEFKDGDGHIQQQFKGMLFGNAGFSGDKVIIKAAQDMFSKFAAGDKSAIDPNIRGSVFGMALKYGGKKEYDTILDTYRNSKNSDERNTALRVLGRAKDPELMKQTLALPFSDEVKEQDIYLPITSLRTHPEGIEALFTWMTDNWDELARRLPAGLSMLGSVVSICTSSFTSQKDLERVQNFFATKNTKGFDQALAQSCDSIRAKSAWLGRDRDDVKKWVDANTKTSIKNEL
ncbi:hypothetical protein B7494_g5130 [Chlorociboria aeruginascens]|nr:hypothetical protein B7494_g5130 [Chlorociboria aeruginascens]